MAALDDLIARMIAAQSAQPDPAERRRQALMATGAGLLAGSNRGFFPALGQGAVMGLNQAQEYDQSVRRDQLAQFENAIKAAQMQRWQAEQAEREQARKAAEQQQALRARAGALYGAPNLAPLATTDPANPPRLGMEDAVRPLLAAGDYAGAAQLRQALPSAAKGEDGLGLAKIDPKDYTPDSFSQYVKTRDPSVLRRFETPTDDWVEVGRTPAGQIIQRNKRTGQMQAVGSGPQVTVNTGENRLFQNTTGLRKEFNDLVEVKNWQTVKPLVQAARDAVRMDTPAADLNLIYSAAKIFDPQSVVRESETQMVMSAQSPAQRFMGYWNNVIGGGRLTPAVRAQLLAQMENRANRYKEDYEKSEKTYRGIASRAGMAAEDIFIERGMPAQAEPTNAAGALTPEERRELEQLRAKFGRPK